MAGRGRAEDVMGLHLGAGRLGLGLVVPAVQRLGEVHVVDRLRDGPHAGDPEQREKLAALEAIHADRCFSIAELPAAQPTLERCEVTACHRVAEGAGLSDIAAVVRSESTLLVTTALTAAGLDAQVPRLEAILELRDELGLATVVIPCENRTGPGYQALVAQHAGSPLCDFVDAVVDRVCLRLRTENDQAVVEVDHHASWIIEQRHPPNPVIARLGAAVPSVTLVDDIAPHREQKLWMTNGPHLLLALEAHAANIERIDEALAEPALSERFRSIQWCMSRAVQTARPGAFTDAELEEYCQRHAETFAAHPDSTKRVMSRFRRRDLAGFFTDLNEKVGMPARVLAANEGDLTPLSSLVSLVGYLVDAGAFWDLTDRPLTRADLEELEGADRAALESFEVFASEWAEPGLTDETADRISSRLARDREVLR